jgi:hypothetical protein
MAVKYVEIGVCGLSCRLCPMYQTQATSKCAGCKSTSRMAVGCPFITCAVKNKGIEFCWQCPENNTCKKWMRHREEGKHRDSFKCYQKLEDDILFIREHDVEEFDMQQKIREALLKQMLDGFNDGRSKSYYCIAATVLPLYELQNIILKAQKQSTGKQLKEKSKILHTILEQNSTQKGYCLKLRK